MSVIEFKAWPKTPRMFRNATITEKIDGTHAAIGIRPAFEGDQRPPAATPVSIINPAGGMITYWLYAQSRKRLITPHDDNYGFAAWVHDNHETLIADLGPGLHYGEWWGKGICRGYGLDDRRFSLFNTAKWANREFSTPNVDTVPVLATHTFDTDQVKQCLTFLAEAGSMAAPGFRPAEGVCVYHHASRQIYKALIEHDDVPKSLVA